MKFLHTADWHIGKRLHEYPLVKEQHDALAQIAQIAQKEQVDAVVVAGEATEYFSKLPLYLIVGRSNARLSCRWPNAKKQVLVAHFFAAGSLRSDSETKIEVGGLDSVPSSLNKEISK